MKGPLTVAEETVLEVEDDEGDKAPDDNTPVKPHKTKLILDAN